MSSREDKRNGTGGKIERDLRRSANTRKSERNATTRIVKTTSSNTPDLRINLTTEDTESQSSSNRMMKRWLDEISK